MSNLYLNPKKIKIKTITTRTIGNIRRINLNNFDNLRSTINELLPRGNNSP